MWTEQAIALWLEEGGPLRDCGKQQNNNYIFLYIYKNTYKILQPDVGNTNYSMLWGDR